MLPLAQTFISVYSVWLVLPSLLIIDTTLAADTLKGLVECMNNEECLGANRVCSHDDRTLTGKCVCRDGYVKSGEGFACEKKAANTVRSKHVTCETDEDCNRNEVCMSWQYDPTLEYARKLRNQLSAGGDQPEKHQFCIDAWIIYNNHLEDLDEPRTGGGLKSNRRNFDAEEYFFSGRRPPRVQQQYIGFAEDMMLILFLVCILATLVTVHRAACYRQIQDARRNTPLRHILPIAEDRPPPYPNRSPDSADGLSAIVCTSSGPKPLTEIPPPTYEEALFRNTVRLTSLEEQAGQAEQEEMMGGDLGREVQEVTTANVQEVRSEETVEDLVLQSREDIVELQAATSVHVDIGDAAVISREPPVGDQILQPIKDREGGQATASDNIAIGEVEVVSREHTVEDQILNSIEDLQRVEAATSENTEVGQDVEEDNKAEDIIYVGRNNLEMEESEKLIEKIDECNQPQPGSCDTDETSNVVNV